MKFWVIRCFRRLGYWALCTADRLQGDVCWRCGHVEQEHLSESWTSCRRCDCAFMDNGKFS